MFDLCNHFAFKYHITIYVPFSLPHQKYKVWILGHHIEMEHKLDKTNSLSSQKLKRCALNSLTLYFLNGIFNIALAVYPIQVHNMLYIDFGNTSSLSYKFLFLVELLNALDDKTPEQISIFISKTVLLSINSTIECKSLVYIICSTLAFLV